MNHTLKQFILLISILLYATGCGQKSDLGGGSPGGNPKVILASPADGTVNFSKDSLDNPPPVQVMFDRDMNSTSVRTNSFLLTACNVEVAHTSDSPSYDPDTRTVTIVPKKLEPNQQYLVHVSRSATDENGNPLSPELFLRFTTGGSLDRYAPTFKGLQSIDVNSSTELTLNWTAATDSFDQATPPEDMEYRIYRGIGTSSNPCKVIFTLPFRTLKSQRACQAVNQNNLPVECSYQVNGDQWSHRITGLSATTDYCFVVRARDLGCHEEPNRTTLSATTKVGGKMYVANLGANNLLVYDNAGEAENVAPREITSDQTQLNAPIGLALGKAMDPNTQTLKKSLYVANFSSNTILAYDWQDGARFPCPTGGLSSFPTGDIAPCRVLGGSLSLLSRPIGLFMDNLSDKLYVTNYLSNAIVVFNKVSTIGTIATPPGSIIISSKPADILPYDNPIGIAVDHDPQGTDPKRDALYVAYGKTGSSDVEIIGIVDQVSKKGYGTIIATRSISGLGYATNNTRLSNPAGLWLDPDQDQGRLYVANRGTQPDNTDDAILVFDQVSSVDGNVSPTWIIRGADSKNPLFNEPYMLSMVSYTENNILKHRLFVANSGNGKILVFDDIDAALNPTDCHEEVPTVPQPKICDQLKPNLVVEGTKTHLFTPRAVVAEHQNDPTNPLGNDTLYIANASPLITVGQHFTYSIDAFENVTIPSPSSDSSTPRLEKKPDRAVSPSLNGPTGVVVDKTKQKLYLSSIIGDSISVFDNINDVNITGNIRPSRRIFGPATGLSGPAGIALAGTRLYVANLFTEEILEFDLNDLDNLDVCKPPQGGFAPDCNISPVSVSTLGLIAVDHPNDRGGAIDLTWSPWSSRNIQEQRIYRGTTAGGPYTTLVNTIPDNATASYTDIGLVNGTRYYYVIRAFDGVQEYAITNEASATPVDNLISPTPTPNANNQLTSPLGIVVDSGNTDDLSDDILYVTYRDQTFSDNRGDSIVVFKRNADGGFSPQRRIKSPNPPLVGPSGLYLDSIRSELYVANRSASSILVFEISDPGICDNTSYIIPVCSLSPIRVITQNTDKGPSKTLSNPNWIFLDYISDPNKLYVTNRAVTSDGQSYIFVYDNAQTVNGNALPVRSIGGLLSPVSLFLDPER